MPPLPLPQLSPATHAAAVPGVTPRIPTEHTASAISLARLLWPRAHHPPSCSPTAYPSFTGAAACSMRVAAWCVLRPCFVTHALEVHSRGGGRTAPFVPSLPCRYAGTVTQDGRSAT